MLRRVLAMIGFTLAIVLSAAPAAAQGQPGLSRLAVAPGNALGSHDGVAVFGGVMPTTAQLDALRGLGLKVQGLKILPMALLRGPRSAMFEAVSRGIAKDVYPNDKLHYFSASSNMAIGADQLHAMGIDGTGVTVAVVDSGIDATHPDLARRVVHNMKMVAVGDPAPEIIIPVEQLPFNNSDTSSGHGTHVAGIIAADNTDGLVKGVAPGASLVGYGMGDAVFVFSAVTAYDDLLQKRADWKIRAINNSYGSSFRLFDPDEPLNQATKAAHDAGITVVFAAGNSSTEMSINPNSVAPWVISVGNATNAKQRAGSSSGGLEFDNSTLRSLPAGDEKYLYFTGDRIGLYHPSVSAPGTNILSTGALTGTLVTSSPDRTATASGTSMACPHVVGVVALMLQKKPDLTPDEIKSALQVTSSLMPDTADASHVQPFWQVGYGFINAKAVVDLVGRHRYNKEKALARLQASADQRVLGDRDESVLRTDYWTFNAAIATVNGTDSRTYKVAVTPDVQAIKALVSYPSLGYVGLNEFDYQITLKDAAGKVVAQTTPASNAGMSKLFAYRDASWVFGDWTVEVVGNLGAQDQDVLMGILVSVAVHQLKDQVRVSPQMPNFTATGSTKYYFTPGAAGLGTSPEGCNLQAGTPVGGMSTTAATGTCQSGSMGYALNYGASIPGSFTSDALPVAMTVGGSATVEFYLTDPLQPGWTATTRPRLTVEIDAVDANGDLLYPVGAAEFQICNADASVCNTGPSPVLGTYTMSIPPVTLPAGARLSVLVFETAAVTSASRTVYGGKGLAGADYSRAGITLTTGTLQ